MTTATLIWTTTRTDAHNIEINDYTARYYATVPAGMETAEAVAQFIRDYEGPETDAEREALHRSLDVTRFGRQTIEIPAAKYEDHDDCLTAAATEYADEHGLSGWDLSPRWADDRNRETILLDVPCH